ncbi:uncharacterized protein LOC116248835 [Nymphaea colorata]|nr:uncharacterized protein LOC116248835 [Nymphaea colorata]
MTTKVVLSVQAHGDEKGKVLRTVTSILGIDDVYTDTRTEKITVEVVGKMDAIDLAVKLRDRWRRTQLIKVYPVEEEAACTSKGAEVCEEKVRREQSGWTACTC